ncbi:Calponin- (CH) domain-containing protein [Trichostrongylus colubriformis]|uniref:Calponin- (CH) domain-containing protein n=1 Tax=Trichostrongylus colubriformis TaxID=6319 RepID=A0AAN8F8P8_TRICO
MSEEQKIVQETVTVTTTLVEEEQAPALPTTEPPKDDVGKPAEPEVTEAPKTEEKPAEEATKEEKPAHRIFKRPTLKWGKKRDEPAAQREPEQAKDIREDALGWIAQQIPPAVHKVNYFVLEWAQKLAYGDGERPALPGKDNSVTRNQFLAFLRDGKLLAALANKLQPGSVNIEPEITAEAAPVTGSAPVTEPEKQAETLAAAEPSKEGEEKKEEPTAEPAKAEEKPAAPAQKTQKEKQADLINQFVAWARNILGFEEGRGITAADLLEKGKAGYPAVFDALWQLAMKAQMQFQQEGIDVDSVLSAASQVVRTNIIQSILNFFKRRPAPVTEKKDEPAEPAPAESGDAVPNAPEGEQVEEEECKKIDALKSAPVAAN